MTTRRWGLGATLLAAALVAVAVLPPRPIPEQYNFAAAVLGFSYRAWYSGHSDYTEKVRRVRDRYAEGIAAPTHGAIDLRAASGPLALRSTREPVVVVRDADVPIDAAREWLREAEAELAAFPRATKAGVPAIIGLHTASIFPGSGRDFFYGFVYAEGRDTACIADVVIPRESRSTRDFRHPRPGGWDGLGRCALYVRYGIPGAGVRTWYGLPPQWRWTGGGVRWELARRSSPRRQIDRIRDMWWGYDWPGFLTCLNSGVACEGVFNPRQGGDDERWYISGEKGILIADLLISRGPEGFVRFWRSPLPVDSALQAAYGLPVGALGREALLRRFIPPPPAGTHRGAAATAVVWLAGFLGLAMVLSRRQTMGV